MRLNTRAASPMGPVCQVDPGEQPGAKPRATKNLMKTSISQVRPIFQLAGNLYVMFLLYCKQYHRTRRLSQVHAAENQKGRPAKYMHLQKVKPLYINI